MRSLPIARRLQLVKLLRAHGVKDVERLREDELKDALARLSILLPDLGADLPYAPLPTSASSSSSSSPPSSSSFSSGDAGPMDDDDVDSAEGLEHFDDPHALPRFREPKPSLPEGTRTFVRAIAGKPGELFISWQLHGDVAAIPGGTRLAIHAVDFVGTAPDAGALLESSPRLVVDVDRGAPGWYQHVPHDRLAIVVRLILGDGDGVVVAVSNVALTPPARPAPRGPFVLASIAPGVDRRALRNARLVVANASLPAGVDVTASGNVDENGVVTDSDGAIVGGSALAALLAAQSPASLSSSPWSRRASGAPSSSSRPSSSVHSKDRP